MYVALTGAVTRIRCYFVQIPRDDNSYFVHHFFPISSSSSPQFVIDQPLIRHESPLILWPGRLFFSISTLLNFVSCASSFVRSLNAVVNHPQTKHKYAYGEQHLNRSFSWSPSRR